MKPSDALEQLRRRGWTVEECGHGQFTLPQAIASRYPSIPPELREFLTGLRACINPTETGWFLCRSDYDGAADSAYRWDEWEQMSLEACDGDEALVAGIQEFWGRHLPFMHCVGYGYGYFAVVTSEVEFGQVVAGFEPLFDEATVVAQSFGDFLEWLVRTDADDLIGESLRQADQ